LKLQSSDQGPHCSVSYGIKMMTPLRSTRLWTTSQRCWQRWNNLARNELFISDPLHRSGRARSRLATLKPRRKWSDRPWRI